ncbi:MAG: FHA domain-containing protein, partial [Nocardioidaceae bacterium]
MTLPATVGRRYTVGRDPSSDVPSNEIMVSREHLKLEWSGTGWDMTDVSARGTFREDGSPLTPRVSTPLPDSTTLRLGDAQSGESLALTLSGLATR